MVDFPTPISLSLRLFLALTGFDKPRTPPLTAISVCFFKVFFDLLQLRHGHLFAVLLLVLFLMPNRPLQSLHRSVRLLQLPRRPVPRRGCSDELQNVPGGK